MEYDHTNDTGIPFRWTENCKNVIPTTKCQNLPRFCSKWCVAWLYKINDNRLAYDSRLEVLLCTELHCLPVLPESVVCEFIYRLCLVFTLMSISLFQITETFFRDFDQQNYPYLVWINAILTHLIVTWKAGNLSTNLAVTLIKIHPSSLYSPSYLTVSTSQRSIFEEVDSVVLSRIFSMVYLFKKLKLSRQREFLQWLWSSFRYIRIHANRASNQTTQLKCQMLIPTLLVIQVFLLQLSLNLS